MRHLIGVFLAIVMAGVLAAGAWGYVRLTALAAALSRQASGGVPLISDHSARTALLAVAGTGLLAGILLAAPRVSPLATALPGVVLLGVTAVYVLGTRHLAGLLPLPSGVTGKGLGTMVYGGVAGAAGLVMTIPVFIPSRWRAPAGAAGPAVAGTAEVTATQQGNVAVLEPERVPGQPGLVSAAPATGALPSRARSGTRPPGGRWPGAAAGGDPDDQTGQPPWPDQTGQPPWPDQTGQRAWPGSPGRPGTPAPGRPTGTRLTSPWRIPDA